MNESDNLEVQQGMSFQVSPLPSINMVDIEHGLISMLQSADDLLFVLDSHGHVIHCKGRNTAALFTYPVRKSLNILDILPATVKRKYELAIEQFQKSHRFTMFESLLALPPSKVNWYEFRLIPTFERKTVLFIWNVNNYRNVSRTVSNIPISIDKMIEGWSRSLYLRDFETEDHTRRVTEMTVQLARRLGLPEEEMLHIRRGAQIHDIGKIIVPDEILLKTGSLTEEEWSVMRQHPLVAVELLESIPQIGAALIIPRSHHEKWDGTGYPDKRAGVNIPLPARIFAFADVYDALTSDRPYRRAWSRTDALEYIRREAGTHFDPSLTLEFIRMLME
jgi:HD-GYP domain-containing protein (c-di-GMP phosphodiesterase class II)